MLTIQKLRKSFGKNQVLNGIDLNFDQAGITAVLGPNGSGKTTLIKCILGMVIPDNGLISFEGRDVSGQWTYREHINYLPQIARFPENLTGYELFDLVKDLRNGTANDRRLIQLFDLQPHLGKRLANLSGGTRQKINLVLAFMYDNPLIILDEPTAGLDPVALLRLKDLITGEKQKGKTILITTHIMSFVEEMADEVVFLLEGKIYFKGSLQHLLRQYGGGSLEYAIANILQGNGQYGEGSPPSAGMPVGTPTAGL
ncbi:MAG TPA: ABC transporter ATP-binding protein [Bacteroidetes bacterium]|nr:ABC transporter ATP-binding protein [Bacteroidota bacterium]